jgi:membrane-associated phospholipid phosphatase
VLVELFELAYLFCYPLVPAGLASLYIAGLNGEADRFWTAVLVAAFGSYGTLPWFSTRPPRTTEEAPLRSCSRVRLLNLRVLDRASIHLNTFPSGHAAAALATALAVGARLPLAGLVCGLIAFGIMAGSVLGRYHYAADALSGAILALIGFAISRFV